MHTHAHTHTRTHAQALISQLRAEVEALQAEGAGPGGRRQGEAVPAELRRLREDNAALRQQVRVSQCVCMGGGWVCGRYLVVVVCVWLCVRR